MQNTVRLSKSQLDHFRELARDSPVEILAYLIGDIVSPELIDIDSFEYTKEYGTQTKGEVSWYVHEYERVKQKAEKRGRRIIGFIHSHPQWDSVMSADDYRVSIVEGFRICGIVSTMGRKTRVRFWLTDSPLPCKREYVTKTKRKALRGANSVPDNGND